MTLILIPALVGSSSTGGVAGVESFEGRQGAVTIQTGDATSSEITNVSSVPGATVTAALDKLSTDLAGLAAGISDWQASVKTVTNTPPGSPAAGDRYLVGTAPTGAWASNAKNIAQWSGSAWVYTAPTAGMATIADDTVHIWAYRASDTTWVDLGGFTAPVTTVFGRQGAVAATAGDYTATQVTNTPAGGVAATTVQAAINELDTEKVATTRSIVAGSGLTGGGDLSGDRTLNVGAGAGITVNADDVAMSDMAQATLKGRASGAGTGAPQDLTPTQARTILNVADGASAAGATGDAYATSHEADTTAHAAAAITVVPTGNVAATNVQGAIAYLDSLIGISAGGGTTIEAGTLTYSNITTTYTDVKASGIDIPVEQWPSNGSSVRLEFSGDCCQTSTTTTNKRVQVQLVVGGTTATLTPLTTASPVLPQRTGTEPAQRRSVKTEITLWRASSTTLDGQITMLIDGVATTIYDMTPITVAGFSSGTINVTLRAALGVAGGAGSYDVRYSLYSAWGAGTAPSAGVTVVATMAALRDTVPSGPDAIIWLAGYAARGDGGEGLFFWDGANTDTHDGGIVISLNAGGSGRWVRWRQSASLYNVRWFATPAACVALANTKGVAGYCAMVYFPGTTYGTYYDLGTLTIHTRVGLFGDGELSRIFGTLTFEGGARNATSPVRDLLIEADVTLLNCRSRLFENVMFTKTTVFPTDGQCNYNTFSHCQWMMVQSGPSIDIGSNNNNNRLVNCRILMDKDTTSPGIVIDWGADGWTIEGCSIEYENGVVGAFQPFMDLHGRSHVISGCWLEREYTSPFTDPGVIIRGKGITFQLGVIGHWIPISDLGTRTNYYGGVMRPSVDTDYDDVPWSHGHGTAAVTTDSGGWVNFQHRMWKTPRNVHLTLAGTTDRLVHLNWADHTHIAIRITDLAGNGINAGSFNVMWSADV